LFEIATEFETGIFTGQARNWHCKSTCCKSFHR